MRDWIIIIIVVSIFLGFLLGYFTGRRAEQENIQQEITKQVIRKEVVATAYNSLPEQTDSSPWITASGYRCKDGVIAANFLPFGTKVWIKGYGDKTYIVRDRMNRRYPNRVDIWMADYDDAIKFGKRKIVIAYYDYPPVMMAKVK